MLQNIRSAYTNNQNEQYKNEIKKTVQVAIASTRIKHLGINLTKSGKLEH